MCTPGDLRQQRRYDGDACSAPHMGVARKSVDFPGFLSSCEMNFEKLLRVFPSLQHQEVRQLTMYFPSGDRAELSLVVEEHTRHTSVVNLVLSDQNAYLTQANMRIRVYHDMKVVEVLSVQAIDVRKSSIRKSKNGLFKPQERLQASTLLGDWLGHCLAFGAVPLEIPVTDSAANVSE